MVKLKKDGTVVVGSDNVGTWSNGDGTFRAEVQLEEDGDVQKVEAKSQKDLREYVQRRVDDLEQVAAEAEGTILVVVRGEGDDTRRVFLPCRKVGTIIRRELDDKEKTTHVHVANGGGAPVTKQFCWEQVMKNMDQWNWSISQGVIFLSGRRVLGGAPAPILSISEELFSNHVEEEVTA